MAVSGAAVWIPSTNIAIKNDRVTPLGLIQNAPRDLVYSRDATTGNNEFPYAGDLHAGHLAICAGYNVRVDARYPNLQELQTIHDTEPISPIILALAKAGVPLTTINAALTQ
jgi:hypothetical protein